jgi:D-serine deaminase-like pyridoxal phosphate-dependent protein
MSIFDLIDQPTLLINEDIAKRNIAAMTTKVTQAGVRFRPHFKTHQSAEIGEWFRALGVGQITVSSVDMAEYFADNGWDDILIAFSLNIRQIARIEALAKRIHLSLLVENLEAVEALSNLENINLDVWMKIDAGAHRTGIDWQDVRRTTDLAVAITAHHNLQFRGLLTHSGNTYHCDGREEVIKAFREGVDHLNILRSNLKNLGFDGLQISVGDTPGCSLCGDFSGIDELRPGNFVFYDAQQFQAGSCDYDQIAVAVACPVVAIHPERREVVIYGGAIHLSKDFLMVENEPSFGLAAFAGTQGWGSPIEGAIVRSLSQEHGVLRFKGNQFDQLHIGDLVYILPAHSCLTVQALRKCTTLFGRVIITMN